MEIHVPDAGTFDPVVEPTVLHMHYVGSQVGTEDSGEDMALLELSAAGEHEHTELGHCVRAIAKLLSKEDIELTACQPRAVSDESLQFSAQDSAAAFEAALLHFTGSRENPLNFNVSSRALTALLGQNGDRLGKWSSVLLGATVELLPQHNIEEATAPKRLKSWSFALPEA